MHRLLSLILRHQRDCHVKQSIFNNRTHLGVLAVRDLLFSTIFVQNKGSGAFRGVHGWVCFYCCCVWSVWGMQSSVVVVVKGKRFVSHGEWLFVVAASVSPGLSFIRVFLFGRTGRAPQRTLMGSTFNSTSLKTL